MLRRRQRSSARLFKMNRVGLWAAYLVGHSRFRIATAVGCSAFEKTHSIIYDIQARERQLHIRRPQTTARHALLCKLEHFVPLLKPDDVCSITGSKLRQSLAHPSSHFLGDKARELGGLAERLSAAGLLTEALVQHQAASEAYRACLSTTADVNVRPSICVLYLVYSLLA